MNHIHSGPATVISLIRTNLKDRYESGFPVLKELIQNADDAGAKILRLGWAAARPAPGGHPLLSGPALFAVNNGPFKKKDARAIYEIGLSSKSSDEATIGKFGLGMKSVFHFSEAVYYLAKCEQLDGGEADGQLNPWCAPEMRVPPVRQGWDRFGAEHCHWLRERLGNLLPTPQHFLLWMPLRLERHHDRQNPPLIGTNFDNYRGPVGDPTDRIFVPSHIEQTAGLLPMLHDLESVEVWLLETKGPPKPVSSVGLEADNVARCLRPDRMRSGQLAMLRGGIKAEAGGQSAHIFGGVTRLMDTPAVRSLSESEYWPFSVRVENESFVSEREKAPPHVGVCWRRRPAEGIARLDRSWAVYLPLSDEGETVDIEGTWNYSLLLHGWFFVDAGRKLFRLAGEPVSQPGDETSLQREWNRELMNAGTLPLIPDSLLEFQSRAGVSDVEMRQLIEGLTRTDLFRKNRAAICSDRQWAYRWRPGRFTWEMIPAPFTVLEIPDPGEAGPNLPTESLPRLADLSEKYVLTPPSDSWPRLALQKHAASWSEDDLVALIASAQIRQHLTDPRLDYLARFIEHCLPPSPLTTLAETLVKLCKGVLSAIGPDSDRGTFASFKTIGGRLPADRRVVFAADLNSGWEPLVQLNKLVPRMVLLPKELEPRGESPRSSGQLSRAEGIDLLKGIAQACADDLRNDFAAAALRLCPNKEDVLKQVADLPLFQVEDLSRNNRKLLVSLNELQTRYGQQCLFLESPENSLAEDLQKAIVDRPVTFLDQKLASLIFEHEKLNPCNSESCESLLLHEPSLAAPSLRSNLLRQLVGQLREPPSTTFGQAIRYLLHGKRLQRDHDVDLYVDHPGKQTVWSKIVEYGLNLKSAAWRWIDGRLNKCLSDEIRAWLNVQQVDRDGTIHILEEKSPQAFALNWSDEDYDTLLIELREKKPLLSNLPIHPDAEGHRHRIEKGKTFWKARFPVDAKLRGFVTILETNSDAYRKKIQLSLAAPWDADQALRVALAQDQPGKYCRVILDALANLDAVPEEFKEQLCSKAWLPRSDKSQHFIQPNRVLCLEGLEDELARATMTPETDYIDAARLDPEVKAHHRGYAVVCQHLLPSPEEALSQLANLLAPTEEYRLGCLSTLNEEDLGELLGAFADAPPGFMPSCDLMRRVPKSISRSGVLKSYVTPLQRSELTNDRLLAILNFLAGQHDREASRSDTLLKVHGWYLSQLEKLIGSNTVPPKLRLLPQSGPPWRSPAELCWGEENIADSHRLCEAQRQILRPKFGQRRKSLSVAESGDEAVPANTPKGDSQDLAHAIEKSATTLLGYFAPWEGLIPDEVLGLLFCVLGGQPRLRKTAVNWLGIHHPLTQTREDMAIRTGPDGIDGCRFVTEIISKRATVSNLLGQLFDAPLSDRCEQLVVDYSPDARIPSKLWNGSRIYSVRFREFHPSAFAERNGSSALLKVLRETVQRLVCEAYHQDPTAVRVYEVFDRLSQATQQGITAAQRLLIDHGLLYLRQQLAPVPEPLATLFKDWDKARHRLYDEEKVRKDGRSLPSGHFAGQTMQDIHENLCRQVEKDARVQELLVKAVHRKITDSQYREHSVPFELFQNADDAYEELRELAGSDSAEPSEGRFIVLAEHDTLAFAHSGRLINQYRLGGRSMEDRGFERDLEKMLVLSSSDKPPEVTGKFGLGFKSVFLLADRPKLLSGALAFEIVAGMYPLALSDNETGRLRELVKRLGMGGGAAPTVVQLGLREPGAGERVLQRFRRLLPILLAFARRIRKCQLHGLFPEQKTTEWNEQAVPYAEGWAVGMLDSPDPGSLLSRRQAVVLRLGDKEALLLGLDPNGFGGLPDEIPSIWVTAPTDHQERVGVALNAPFALDIGRSQLGTADIKAHYVLADKLGFAMAYGAAIVPFDTSLEPLVRALGNGSNITCQDTVPMCLWVAARHLDDYQLAVVAAIRARGDIDTNAAIVGGIVALATRVEGIPRDWRAGREGVDG